MNVFKMTRTNGILLAIANVLVRQLGVGNFVVQMDTASPARLGDGRKDYWMEGYTDTGRFVSSDFWLKWEEGLNPNLAEARVSFGYCPNGSSRIKVFNEFTFSYSPEQGVFVRS